MLKINRFNEAIIYALREPAAWIGAGLIALSMAWIVSSISSCAAEESKSRYRYLEKASEAAIEKLK